MTGNMVFERALSYLMEKPGLDRAFSAHALTLINQLIAEALPYQNSRNRAADRAQLKSYAIGTLDEEIALDPPIAEVALPLGLASEFFRDEVDAYHAQVFRERFELALNNAKRYREDSIADIYGGEE